MENNCTLIGYVGKDPKIQSTRAGKLIARFSLATSRIRKEGDDWKTDTEWHNIVCFGYNAEKAEKRVKKGTLVTILGMIHYEEWEDREGQMHYQTQIFCNRLIVLTKREKEEKKENGRSKEQRDQSRQEMAGTQTSRPEPRDEEDDLPF